MVEAHRPVAIPDARFDVWTLDEVLAAIEV
jgi:hypothetical protein